MYRQINYLQEIFQNGRQKWVSFFLDHPVGQSEMLINWLSIEFKTKTDTQIKSRFNTYLSTNQRIVIHDSPPSSNKNGYV